MQYKFKDYNREKHDVFKALTVKQPYADHIASGLKTIEIRPRRTKYRGYLIITSSQIPVIPKLSSGVTIAAVNLIDCVPVSELTDHEWLETMIPLEDRHKYLDHFAWILQRNREVIEFPVTGQLGLWNLIMDKDELMEYPRELINYLNLGDDEPKPKVTLWAVLIFIILFAIIFFLTS